MTKNNNFTDNSRELEEKLNDSRNQLIKAFGVKLNDSFDSGILPPKPSIH